VWRKEVEVRVEKVVGMVVGVDMLSEEVHGRIKLLTFMEMLVGVYVAKEMARLRRRGWLYGEPYRAMERG